MCKTDPDQLLWIGDEQEGKLGSGGRGEGLSVMNEDDVFVTWLPLPLLPLPLLLPLLSRLSLSYPLPPPFLTPFPPSPRRQGWIPAFISTIQPRCLLATEHGSFNCPPQPPNPPSCILLFHPRSYIQRASRLYSHGFLLVIFASYPESETSEPGLFPLRCGTCLPGSEHSNCISATLEAQTDRQERLFCQDVSPQDPAGARNTHSHTINGRRQASAPIGLKGPPSAESISI